MNNDTTSAIDKAIAAAKARKLSKESGSSSTTSSSESVPRDQQPKVSSEEKLAKQEARRQEQLAKKEARTLAREAKKAARAGEVKTPHLSKVAKAAARLPVLSEDAASSFRGIIANLPASQVDALAAHLAHFNREAATQRALTQKVSTGDSVRIISGNPKYVGMSGTVSKAQRIRCYVEIEGVNKPVYLFTSDVEVVAATFAATGTDG